MVHTLLESDFLGNSHFRVTSCNTPKFPDPVSWTIGQLVSPGILRFNWQLKSPQTTIQSFFGIVSIDYSRSIIVVFWNYNRIQICQCVTWLWHHCSVFIYVEYKLWWGRLVILVHTIVPILLWIQRVQFYRYTATYILFDNIIVTPTAGSLFFPLSSIAACAEGTHKLGMKIQWPST